MDDVAAYVELDCLDIVRGVRDGHLSPVGVLEAALALIQKLDPVLNCYAFLDTVEARRTAGRFEVEARAGRFRGPLHGLPLSIKDNLNVPGIPTARGSKRAAQPATDWSPLAERVHDAGAMLLGKTTMPEMGWTVAGTSPCTGSTRNPWDIRLTSGGSSSGSASAVAARMVPAALGTDAGGSIRIPAAFCGLFGLKPSFGRIPIWPGSANERVLHHGFLTRSVLDTALLLDIGKGPDKRDPYSLPAEQTHYLKSTAEERTGLRIGYAASPWMSVEPESASVIDRCMSTLGQKFSVAEVRIIGGPGLEAYEILWSAARLATTSTATGDANDDADPDLVTATHRAKRHGSLFDYLRANAERRALSERVEELFDEFDILIMPTVPIKPFDATASGPNGVGPDRVLPWLEWSPCTYPFNLTGHPAASLPCGFTAAGLPVGIQVVGPRFGDAVVLNACHAIERLLDVKTRMPSVTSNLL